MRKFNKKILSLLLISAVLCGFSCACVGCSKEGDPALNLERTVYLGLLEEVKTLDLSDTAREVIDNLSQVALNEDASVFEILNAIDQLNGIKNEFLNEALVFVDSALKAKVCNALGKSDYEVITVKDVLNVRILDLSYTEADAAAGKQQIHYVTDLRKFPALTEVTLDGNELYSLDGIKDLSGLKTLSISKCFTNTTEDLSPIAEIEGLEKLDISYNNVTGLAVLSELKALTSLDISGVTANDIFVIAGFTNLTELSLNELTVKGEMLAPLKNLEVLEIADTVFETDPKLYELANLKKLNISGQPSRITEQVRSLKSLTTLAVKNCGLTSADIVLGLKNLTYLNLSDNELTSFTSDGFPELLTLNLSGNKIQTVNLMGDHSSLVKANFSNNELVTINATSLSGLTELNISDNPISDGSFSESLSEIKIFNAANTKFTEIDLSHCTKLTEVSLSRAPLESTAGLVGLSALKHLDLYGTNVFDVTAFAQMSELETLTITLKNVEDYSPFAGLTSIRDIKIFRMNNADWDYICSMKSLNTLYIENSNIKEPHISGLPELKELRIIDCPRTTGTSLISDLPELTYLEINGSDIATPTIRDLPKLETLVLINSDVEYPEKIANLPVLKHLDLSGNDLEALVFSELPSLEYLNVSKCRIVTIKDLNAEMSYGTLILSDNYITDISVLPKVYSSLKSLDISNNRIKKFTALDSMEIGQISASGNKAEYKPAE